MPVLAYVEEAKEESQVLLGLEPTWEELKGRRWCRAHACQWCPEPYFDGQRQTDAAVSAMMKGVGNGGGKL